MGSLTAVFQLKPGNLPGLFLSVCFLLPVCSLLGASTVAAAEPPQPHVASPDELRYKSALYHYYRKDYLTALTELRSFRPTVAPSQAAPSANSTALLRDQARLLQGGIYLALDMEPEARAVFQAAAAGPPGAERNVALFHLGKMAYRDGDYAAARAHLGRVDGDFEADIRDEWLALRVNLALKEGDLERAAELQADIGNDEIWARYGLFNMGAAHLQRRNLDEGLGYLDKLIGRRAKTEEQQGLRDRALAAAGYGYLGQEDYASAESYFEQVPINSPQAARALLGYGLALSKTDGYRAALTPWLELSELRPVSPSVQESFLAVSYAYEQLDKLPKARTALKRADILLTNEVASIGTLSRRIAKGGLGSVFTTGMTTGASVPWHHLIDVLSGPRFQHYRQVQQSQRNLRRELEVRQERMAIYRDLLQSKRNRWAGSQGENRLRTFSRRLTQLRRDRNTLVATLEQARRDGTWLDFAEADTQLQWSRLLSAEQRMLRLAEQGLEAQDEAERLERVRGTLMWEGTESARRWFAATERSLAELERAIAEADLQYAGLQDAINQQQKQLDRGLARLVPLERRVAKQLQALDQYQREADESFREYVLEELTAQKSRLKRYHARIRVARARLLDEATL